MIGCALAILAASVSAPGDGVPRTFFGVGFTVYLHLFAYAGLTVTLGYAFLSTDRRALVLAVTLATGYGAVIELLQGTIPYRTMTVTDVVINAVGAVVGSMLWSLVAARFGVRSNA